MNQFIITILACTVALTFSIATDLSSHKECNCALLEHKVKIYEARLEIKQDIIFALETENAALKKEKKNRK